MVCGAMAGLCATVAGAAFNAIWGKPWARSCWSTSTKGTDSVGVAYVDVTMSETHTSGISIKQHYVLRDTEAGVHMFTELKYSGSSSVRRDSC